MSRFFAGMVTGAVLLFVAMHYHIVHAQDGLHLVPKLSNDLQNVYVDIRSFTLDDWRQHKMVAAALVESKKGHVLEDAGMSNFSSAVGRLVDGLFHDSEVLP